MPKKLDIVGNVYGKLTVVESLGVKGKDKAQYVRCSCSCGGEKSVRATTLIQGRTKSCGCLQTGPQMRLELGEASFNKLYGRYKRDAKDRGLSFSLDREAFKGITKQDCHYCGSSPASEISCGTSNGVYLYNGVDRKDSREGYEPHNVVPCCGFCNMLKRAYNDQDFIRQAVKIAAKWKETLA